MQTSISHISMVINFLDIDIDFDSNQISEILKKEVDKIVSNFSTANLEDWRLDFVASYTNGRQPLISKNKLGSFTGDKIKQITIVIPVPTIDTVSWGVNSNQHIFKIDHFDKLIKNFNTLDVNYSYFNNRIDYILECLRMGIKVSFSQGFTVNKEKFKLKKRITVANS